MHESAAAAAVEVEVEDKPIDVGRKQPRHILALTKAQKLDFLNSFDCIFSDIDGVMWLGESHSIIKGAPEGYKLMEQAGKSITFISNNSVRTTEACLCSLAAAGMKVSSDRIWHPALNVVKYLKSIKFEGLLYVIATKAFKQVLHDAGFKYIDGPNQFIEESFGALCASIFDSQPVRAVVIDVDFNLSSPKLLRAHLYLRQPECLLIAGATDLFIPVGRDVNIMGPGPFSKALIEASGKQAITLGKPGAALRDLLMREHAISEPRRALMVGDMLEQDIGFGSVCGFQTLFVLSGACTLEDLQRTNNPDEHIPDYYADSIGDFIEFLSDIEHLN